MLMNMPTHTALCSCIVQVLQGDEESLSFARLLFWQLWAGSGNGKSLNLPLLIRKTRGSLIASHSFLSVPKRKGKGHMLKNKGLKEKHMEPNYQAALIERIDCYGSDTRELTAMRLLFSDLLVSDSRLFWKYNVVPPRHGHVLWASERFKKCFCNLLQQSISNVIGEWRWSSLGVDDVFLYLE